MRTLVYEPRVGGHFLNIAGQVASALSDAGADSHIVVATKAPGLLEFESAIAPLRGRVTVHSTVSFEETGSALKNALRSYSTLAATVLQIKPERTYLPTADALVQVMAIARFFGQDKVLKRTHLEGLLMNGSVGHPELLTKREHWKRWIAHGFAKWGCHTLFHLNPFVRDWELLSGIPESRCIRTMPDPVEVQEMSKESARSALGLPQEARIAGMVGRLDHRKGAHVLIDAFLMSELGPKDMILLWGPISEGVRPHIQRLVERANMKGRVLLRENVLELPEFYQAIAAMDLLVLPYTSVIGSSSIVIRAAAARRPVVTTSGGWAERVMRTFPLGWTFDGPDPKKLATILPECLERAENWTPGPATRKFVEYNSPENFAAHWSEGLRTALGLPGDPRLQEWRELLRTADSES